MSSFLDKALLQALIYSLMAHIVLFGTFKIRLNDYQETAQEMTPVDVAIDFEEPATEAGVFEGPQVDTSDLFFTNSIAYLPELDPSAPIDAFSDEELVEQEPKERSRIKMYPLQLKLSQSLKNLELLDDGSSLFRNKEPYETMSIFTLAPHHFAIDYKLYVQGLTGTLERFERKGELLDKRLQAVADKIVNKIRFCPYSEKSITGSITLTFFCTGDDIKGYLE